MNAKALANIGSAISQDSGGLFSFSRGVATSSNISGYIANIQFQRYSHDINMWREAIKESELAWFPSRVRLQRMYMDTIVNPYVKSLIDRWREITLQRDYEVYFLKNGKKEVSEVLSQALNEQYWFGDYLEHVMDAKLYGYSLVSLGDMVDDGFPKMKAVLRENILPDGQGDDDPILTQVVYNVDGLRFEDSKIIKMCNHFFTTKPERGNTTCGWGALYEMALLEIHHRHSLEWNVDYVEQFGMPVRVGSTRKQGKEKKNFESFLAASGSNPYLLIDKDAGDSVEFIMSESVGTGWKSYENLEGRLEQKMSQLMLGHADAMASSPGKLGSQQATNKDNETPVDQALSAKQTMCGNYLKREIDQVSAPAFRELGRYTGSSIIKNLFPPGAKFGLANDREELARRRRINTERTTIFNYVKAANESGWDIDKTQLEDITGFTLTASVPEHKLIEDRTNKIIKEDDPESTTPAKTTGKA